MTDVWKTVENMRTLDSSLYSFFQTLEADLKNQDAWSVNNTEVLNSKTTPNEWCEYSEYRNYRLNRPPQGRRGPPGLLGYLTVGVELWREVNEPDTAWCHARQPLIYVGFAPGRDWWDEDLALDYRGDPVSHYDGTIVVPTEETPFLWKWDGEDGSVWCKRSWFFVLQLLRINSRNDLQREIIEPLSSLLCGSSPNDAFNNRRAIRHGGVQP